MFETKSDRPFTITRLQTLRLCPYRHHLQYELGIRVGGPASRRGTALHEAVSGLLFRWGQTDPETEIARVAEKRSLKPAEREHVSRLVRKFKELMAPRIRQVMAVEEPIELRIEHLTVAGRVDAAVETGEGLELWELKTGRRGGYLDTFPLGVYALGMKEVLGKVPDRWAYVRLQQGSAEAYMGGEGMAAGVKEEVRRVVSQLWDVKEPEPNPGLWCRGCPCQRWCKAVRAEPEPLPVHQGWLWTENRLPTSVPQTISPAEKGW